MMMLRELAHSFLVGGLLVSVTSAQSCSVCGDGYQVGSPSTLTSLTCPWLSDSHCSCNDLQYAGLQGLIAIDKCPIIAVLIFETCDCQESTVAEPSYTPSSFESPAFVTTMTISAYVLLSCFVYILIYYLGFYGCHCSLCQSRNQNIQADSHRHNQASPQNLPMPPGTNVTSTARGVQDRLPLVLEVLFPNETKVRMVGAASCSGSYCFLFHVDVFI